LSAVMCIYDEQPILLRDLARVLPERPNYDTVLKWCRRGLLRNRRGVAKRRVKIECVRLTTGLGSSIQAYRRFLLALDGREV
jgi:hypothetical protein